MRSRQTMLPSSSIIGEGRATLGTVGGHPLTFLTRGAERMRLLADGGLTFNGDTAQANALDDYEEGTFAPFTAAQINNHNITIPAQAHYIKVGRLVQIWMRILYNGTNGEIITGNMPFPSSNPSNNASYSPFFLTVFPNNSSPTNMCFAYLGGKNTTTFTIYQTNNGYIQQTFNAGPTELTVIGAYRSS